MNSNNNFDLNIENYKINDMLKILSVPSTYDINIISQCYNNKLQECINYKVSNDILIFLNKIKERLISEIENKNIVNKTTVFNTSSNSVLEQNNFSIEKLIDNRYVLNPIEVLPTQISKSNLNNLKRKTNLVTLVFNTKFLYFNNYKLNNNEYIFNLPTMFKYVYSLRLSSLQLPHSIYSFTCNNNKFFIKENNTNNSSIICIEPGNYDSTEIGDYLEDLINKTLSSMDRFEVNLNVNNGKISITNKINTFSICFNVINDNFKCFVNTNCCEHSEGEHYLCDNCNYHSENIDKNTCGKFIGFFKIYIFKYKFNYCRNYL